MRNAPKTRASLILRLRNREDLDAWREFADIYQPLVFRLARQKGFQDSDAADISQEVLVRVAGAVERWDPAEEKGTFRGWLYRISRNLMINFLSRQRRQPTVVAETADLLAIQPDANAADAFDREYERQVFASAAERIRDSFQENTWQAFWRSAVDNQPIADVASNLGISVGMVYVARTRVMGKLRQEVRKLAIQDGGEVSA